ncbi:MAG: hypothetical protein H6678_14645 [Candidatus Delongbacteria bacterium]|nr:hypothetical protein [Candidatus Delongbacteria bacterium]
MAAVSFPAFEFVLGSLLRRHPAPGRLTRTMSDLSCNWACWARASHSLSPWIHGQAALRAG